ncbi:MAG: 16S rRNA (guanine(527)-N(7))-methyltransferase RsmG [Prevotellaceae bacterium]|jgi:16S rRNA (guanine527-N7)-methyltransferase|nr:16S rRNA (guanine(527)-N(7))-methyltransferase RsmG [Prevotellaceae bacterium]
MNELIQNEMSFLIKKYFPELTERQIKQFEQLQPIYADWNDKINVVSRKDIDNLYLHHLLHSLAVAKVVKFLPGADILDVGTGGGFPALPLAVMFPESHFTAIDSIGKKIKVVSAVSEAVGLTNLKALQTREDQLSGAFDFVLCRAVTDLATFITWVAHKVKPRSRHALPNGIVCLKGGDLKSEIELARKKFSLSRTQITEYNIRDFFDEEYFETKKVVYVQI